MKKQQFLSKECSTTSYQDSCILSQTSKDYCKFNNIHENFISPVTFPFWLLRNSKFVLIEYEQPHDKTCLQEFPPTPDTNQPAQPQKLARVLKFRLQNLEILYYLSSEQQVAHQTAWMRRLTCTFVVRIWHKTHFLMAWLICIRKYTVPWILISCKKKKRMWPQNKEHVTIKWFTEYKLAAIKSANQRLWTGGGLDSQKTIDSK